MMSDASHTRFAEDFETGEVYHLGSHTITTDEIVSFARNYDPQDYHLSEESGQRSCFNGLIASGWNTACIWMNLYVITLLKNAAVEGSPGVDELRWLSPVRPGDVLNGQVEILNKIPSSSQPNIVTIRKKGRLIRGNEAKPVCTLILHSRFKKRP